MQPRDAFVRILSCGSPERRTIRELSMQRSWNVIRELLEKFEDESIDSFLDSMSPSAVESINDDLNEQVRKQKTQTEDMVFGHLLLLIDSTLVGGIKVELINNEWMYSTVHPRLTSAGHDLLDSLRSKTVWNAVKATAQKLSIPVSFELIKAVAVKLATNI